MNSGRPQQLLRLAWPQSVSAGPLLMALFGGQVEAPTSSAHRHSHTHGRKPRRHPGGGVGGLVPFAKGW